MAARGALQTAIEAAPGFGAVLVGGRRGCAGRPAGRRRGDARLRRRDVGAERAGGGLARLRAFAPGPRRAAARIRGAAGQSGQGGRGGRCPRAPIRSSWRRGRVSPSAPATRARWRRRWRRRPAPRIPAAPRRSRPGARLSSTPRSTARGGRRILEDALRDVPDDPAALPLLLLEDAVAPAAAGEALWRAGAAARGRVGRADRPPVPAGRERERRADHGRLRRGRTRVGVARGCCPRIGPKRALLRAVTRLPGGSAAACLAERAVDAAGAAAPRAAVDAADVGVALVVAEALAEADDAQAPAAFGALAGGRLRPTRGGRSRLDARAGAPDGGGGLGAARAACSRARRRCGRRRAATVTDLSTPPAGELGRCGHCRCGTAPPHEGAAGPATLHAAALLAEGRGETGDGAAGRGGAERRRERFRRRAAVAVRRASPRGRQIGAAGGAMELAAARFTPWNRRRSRSPVVDSMRARLADDAGDRASAAEHWRAALVVDPGCLPAARAIRRDVARRGDLALALDATEAEAACLRVPEHRVRALAAGGRARRGRRARPGVAAGDAAAGSHLPAPGDALLRAALEIDPGHDGGLRAAARAARASAADARRWPAALAARIAVAANPFEMTSLRLARAELLAGHARRSRGRARASWRRSCTSSPSTPRALARLSELLWDAARRWSEAGELYLRRAVVEREPDGAARDLPAPRRTSTRQRVPDAKRAIAAYERVLRRSSPTTTRRCRRCPISTVAEGDTKQRAARHRAAGRARAGRRQRTAYARPRWASC